MTTQIELGQNLIDTIIDNLQDNPDTLNTLSLTSHACYARSHIYIHSKFTFKGSQRCIDRANFYAASPGLLSLIRTLVIDRRRNKESKLQVTFPKVDDLFLHGLLWLDEASDFKDYIKTELPLVKSLSLGSKAACTFESLASFANFLQSFPLLSSLALDVLSLSDLSGAAQLMDSAPRLEYLRLHLTDAPGPEMTRWLSEQSVKPPIATLSLPWTDKDPNRNEPTLIQELCGAASASLKHLKLKCGRRCGRTNVTVDISTCDQLESLQFDLSLIANEAFAWVPAFISTVNSPHFRHLILRPTFKNMKQIKTLDLLRIDEEVHKVWGAETSRKVEVVLPFNHRKTVGLAGDITKRMPKAAENGSLTVSFTEQ